MKHILLATALLATLSLVACSGQESTLTQPTARNRATVPPIAQVALTTTPTQSTASDATEEAEIRNLVENFGKRLQLVSLLAPDVAQEIQKQYSEFVSPTLLELWVNTVSKAPGRMVSSPWPDRIEVTTLTKEDSDRYAVSGLVIEITSTEVMSGEASAKLPVRIVVQREQGRWLITEYSEQQ